MQPMPFSWQKFVQFSVLQIFLTFHIHIKAIRHPPTMLELAIFWVILVTKILDSSSVNYKWTTHAANESNVENDSQVL